MKNILSFTIITVLAFLSVYLFLFNRRVEYQTVKIPAEPSQSIINLKRNIIVAYENSDIKLRDTKIYRGSDSTKTLDFFSNVTGPTLVFRFSGNYCDECINMIVEKIKKFLPDFANNNRIYLVTSELNSRMKDGFYGKKTLNYKIANETLGLPIEHFGVPVLFIVGKDKMPKMVFLPQKSEPALIDEYLQLMKFKYFNN